jgi:hypothetical protein
MTDFDLERLGDVWRQQPDPAELERLQRSAAAVGRRARWARLFNIGAAIVVANPQRSSVLMGSAAIFLLLYSNIRSRRIRDIELRGLTGTTENMLDQSIERVGATLKYNLFTLIGLGPAIVIGYLFADSATSSGEGGISMLSPEIRFMLGAGGVIAIASSVAFLLLAVRRGRRELQRLAAMRDSFREERKSSNY